MSSMTELFHYKISMVCKIVTFEFSIFSAFKCFSLFWHFCTFFPLPHIRKVDLEKAVTSIATFGDGKEFFVGTEAAQMYRFSYENFKVELISTSHNDAVKDVAILL